MEWSVCQREGREPPPWGLPGLFAGIAVPILNPPTLSESLGCGPRDLNF